MGLFFEDGLNANVFTSGAPILLLLTPPSTQRSWMLWPCHPSLWMSKSNFLSEAMNPSLNGPCSCYVSFAIIVKLFTWPMAAFQGIWPSMACHGLPWPSMPISLPFDGLLQDIRELIDPTDCRHALLRAQAAAGAACLSSMS